MENSTDDFCWDDIFNSTTSSIDVQMAHSDFELWDQMIFSDPGTLNGAPDLQSSANPSIDSIITTPQNVQNLASNNQEPLHNLDNEAISPSQLALQSYTLPLGELNVIQDIKKEAKELRDMLQEVKRELVTMKGQFQTAQSELYTIKSNHAQLLRWTLDMGETTKALLKWLTEHIGANIVGQDGFCIEDLGSWLNTGSED